MRRPLLAIAGDGTVERDTPAWSAAFALGRGAVEAGLRVLTGGCGGVMEAAGRGAHAAANYREGDVVGLLPGDDASGAGDWVDIALPTGLGHVRNALVARADALVAIGGGAGTLSEMAFAWMHGRPVVALVLPGWSGRLADQRLDERVRRPDVPDDRIFAAHTADEAIAIVVQRLAQFARG